MYLHEALGIVTAQTVIVNTNDDEILMLSIPEADRPHDLELLRVDESSAEVKEAFQYEGFDDDLETTIADIVRYAETFGFADDAWDLVIV